MDDDSPEPIEPASSPRLMAEAEALLWEVEGLSRTARGAWAIFMLLAAVSCLGAAYFLTSELHNWVAWALAVILLEPMGMAGLLAAIFLVAPSSSLGQWFAGSIHRARLGLLALLFVLLGSLATGLGWMLWEMWKLEH